MKKENHLTDLSIDEIKQLIDKLSIEKNKRLESNIDLHSFYIEYCRFAELNFSKKYQKSIHLSFKHLLQYFGDEYLLSELSNKKITEFINHIKSMASKGYRVYYRTLKAAFTKAVLWDYLKDNPFTKVKLQKTQSVIPTFITREQLNAILANCNNNTLRVLFLLAFLTGCRLSEVVLLRWSTVDMKSKIITIGTSTFETKTKEQRFVPITLDLYNVLLPLFQTKGKSDYVFCKSNGFPYNVDYVSKYFKKIIRKTNMNENIHFHSLRHSFASQLVQKQVPIYTVQKLLGHKSVSTTEIYAHLNTDELRKAVNKLNQVA